MQKNAEVKKQEVVKDLIEVEVPEEVDLLPITQREDGLLDIAGRWVIDPDRKFALCLSEEFEQSIMTYTQKNKDEWGGFIVGHDVEWINPENQRVVKIMVCERAIVLGQTRSGGSFEILESVVDEWMNSNDREGEQSFMTVFAVNKWKKIGWVHSHADMGVFWSGTDTATMKDMNSMGTLVSIVYSRNGKGLNRLIRIDKNSTWFGGSYNLQKNKVSDNYVYAETEINTIDDVPKDIQKKYVKLLSETRVIETTVHTPIGAKTTPYTQKGGYSYKHKGDYGYGYGWDDYDVDYPYPGKGFRQTYPAAGSIVQTTLSGEKVVGGKQENNPKTKKLNLTLALFFSQIGEEFDALITKFKEERRKVKLKEIVDALDDAQVIVAIDFFDKKPATLLNFAKEYHNFPDLVSRFVNLLAAKVDASKVKPVGLNSSVVSQFGISWAENCINKANAALVEAATVNTVDTVEETKPIPEPKVMPFIPDKSTYDWKDWFIMLPTKYRMQFLNTLFYSIDEAVMKKILDKIEDGFTYVFRNEEKERANQAAILYENLLIDYDAVSPKYKDAFHYLYASFIRNALSVYFDGYTKKEEKLQWFLNAVSDKKSKDFINDFIVQYKTKKQLQELVEKQEIKVHQKTYVCPHCEITWPDKKGMETCIKQCQKMAFDKQNAPVAVIATSSTDNEPESKKVEKTTETKDKLAPLDIRNIEYMYGTPVEHFTQPCVCRLCGRVFETQEAADACITKCGDFLAELKENELKLGPYKCPACREKFDGLLPAIAHENKCINKEAGAVFAYILYGAERAIKQGLTTLDKALVTIINFYKDTTGELPEFINWLMTKIAGEKVLNSCSVCGEFIDVERPVENIVLTFMHEKYCKSENKKDTVFYGGYDFECGLCVGTIFQTANIDVMINHLLTRHGIYISRDELKSKQKEYLAQAKKDIMISTPNISYNGLYKCVRCNDKPIRYLDLASVMDHIVSEHKINPFTLHSDIYLFMTRNGAKERRGGYFITDSTLFIKGTFGCRYCPFTTTEAKAMFTHMVNVHGINVTVRERNEWDHLVENYEELDFSKENNKPNIDVQTPYVVMYNGVIECLKCHTVAASTDKMLEHFTKEHPEVNLSITEFSEWEAYMDAVANAPKPEEDDDGDGLYENDELKEMYDAWFSWRKSSEEPIDVCNSCGLVFDDFKDEVKNSWACFTHEMVCFGGLGEEDRTCMYCQKVFPTEEERDEHEDVCNFDERLMGY